jgi:hypothetical protein
LEQRTVNSQGGRSTCSWPFFDVEGPGWCRRPGKSQRYAWCLAAPAPGNLLEG